MLTKPVYLEIDKPNYVPIYTVQYDYNSRFYEITILNNSQPLDLTGIRVIVAGKKPDGKEVFNSCKVLDAKKGLIQLELTEQMNAVNGASEYALELFSADGMLSSQPFKLIVTRSTISKSVESSKELGALKDALNEVQDIDNRFAQTNAQLSQKANSNEVRHNETLIELADLSTEVKKTMTGGSVAVVGNDAVNLDTLVDGSVGFTKLKKNIFGENSIPTTILQKSNWEVGTINDDGTNLDTTNRLRLTNKLSVKKGTVIRKLDVNYKFNVFIYNLSGGFIRAVSSMSTGGVDGDFLFSEDCYIRINVGYADNRNISQQPSEWNDILNNTFGLYYDVIKEVEGLKDKQNYFDVSLKDYSFSIGTLANADGEEMSSSSRIRSNNFVYCDTGSIIRFNPLKDRSCELYYYDVATQEYLGSEELLGEKVFTRPCLVKLLYKKYGEMVTDDLDDLYSSFKVLTPLPIREIHHLTWKIGSVSGANGQAVDKDGFIRSFTFKIHKGMTFKKDNDITFGLRLYNRDGLGSPSFFKSIPTEYFDENELYVSEHDCYARAIIGSPLITNDNKMEFVSKTKFNIYDCYGTHLSLELEKLKKEGAKTNTLQIRDAFKEPLINLGKTLNKMDGCKIGFITDAHYYHTNDSNNFYTYSLSHYENIIRLSQLSHLDCIVDGGDRTMGYSDKDRVLNIYTDLNDVIRQSNAPFLDCQGNHDTNDYYYFGMGTKSLSNIVSPVEFSNNFYVENDVNTRQYFYYDIPKHKIRVICLNSNDGWVTDENGYPKYNREQPINGVPVTYAILNEQIEWLCDVLQMDDVKRPQDWAVIVFSHQAVNQSSSGSTMYTKNMDIVLEIFKAYQSGATYQINRTDGDFSCQVDVNFNRQGEIIFMACGHTHYDRLVVEDGIHYINTACSLCRLNESTVAPGSTYPTRELNTLSEDAWDVFCIDRKKRKVTIKRFGAGSDREFDY